MNLKKIQFNKGMTYVELIVVLGIFSVLMAVVLFDYQKFQDKIDIRNLSNEIALSVVGAQKDSMSGRLNASPFFSKPSYGVYFDINSNNKIYTYFADLNNNGFYDSIGNCPAGECVDILSIASDETINSIKVYYYNAPMTNENNISILFTRPESAPSFSANNLILNNVSYVVLEFVSPSLESSNVLVFASGRVQIN
jgi:prepilin-type N-terminal cleavage/methylation domain-containing protein